MKKTFFIHIPKTGGSTFNKFLANHFIGIEHCESQLTIDGEFIDILQIKKFEYVSGHIKFLVFEANDFPRDEYFLVTFIRDPISQLISHLNWVIHIYDIDPVFFASHPKIIQDISLELRSLDLYNSDSLIYALKKFDGLFKNNQSKYFADSSGTIDKDNVIEKMSQLDVIGITEHHINLAIKENAI